MEHTTNSRMPTTMLSAAQSLLHMTPSKGTLVLTPLLLLSYRLDALLSALSKGKGDQLTNPWPIIHPDNAVTSLSQALDPKHDDYYKKLPKFKFLHCLDHYESGESHRLKAN
jgi:hypothetical protein